MPSFFVALVMFGAVPATAQAGPAAEVGFDRAAAHCFGIADERSSAAASGVMDYDGDSAVGAIGSGLALSIERKRLRKRIYMACMDANGFPKARYVKVKRKA